jgi:hypothetical protein
MYFSILNCTSEYGLSFEYRGRECDRETPRSIINSDTGFEVIDPPRSAWIVCGTSAGRNAREKW